MLVQQPKKPPLIVASSIIPREMQWLWYPYIPSSSATLLFGPGGYGKSHISVDIVAHLTTGRPLPGQAEGGMPQKVLMLSAEDEFDVVLVPRLLRAGADLRNVGFPKDPFTLDKRGIAFVEEYMHEFAATVVFIDPIVQYMGGKVDMHKANEVREFMGDLHQLAIRKQTAIVIVGHSRKSRADDGAEDHEKAMGSADFNNAVRSALFVTKGNDGTRIMKHVKSNYAPLGPSLGYEFGEHGFHWTGQIDDEGMLLPVREQKRSTQDKWLRGVLADGPVAADRIERLGREAGYSMRTINRIKPGIAESFMAIQDGKPKWFWKLIERAGPKETEDEIPVFDVADSGFTPDAPSGRNRVGRSGKSKAARRTGGPDGSVADGGRRGRKADVLSGPAKANAPDPKALAAAFLAQHGLA